MAEFWGGEKPTHRNVQIRLIPLPLEKTKMIKKEVSIEKSRKKTHKYSMMRSFLAVGNQGREIECMITSSTHDRKRSSSHSSLFKTFNSVFKNLESFLPSIEEFGTANDVLNLLLPAPEEAKESTLLQIHCQVPRGPDQKHMLPVGSFGISA